MRTNIPSLCLTLSLFAGVANAQATPCASANDQNNAVFPAVTGWRFAGPGKWAHQFTPSRILVAKGMRIFTGKGTGNFMTLEVHDQDPSTKLPKSRLAGGTWHTPRNTPNGWQGANFDKTIILRKGVPYWFVWIEPGGCQLPWAPTGPQTKTANWTASGWRASTNRSFKFRLYCSLLDDKNVASFGTACAAANSAIGTTFSNQAPASGNKNFRVEGSGFPSGTPAFCIIGANKNFPGLKFGPIAPGCSLNTDIVLLLPFVTGTGNQRAKAALGHVTVPLPLVGIAKGTFFATQLAAFDKQSKNALKFAFGNALRITVN